MENDIYCVGYFNRRFACRAFLLQETLPVKERTQSSTIQSILGLRRVAKNPNFSSLLLVGAFIAAPFMAYLALASYIYIDGFGVSETTFSMYFALNAAASILGPVMYMRFGAHSVKKVDQCWDYRIHYFCGIDFNSRKYRPIIFLLSYVIFSVVTSYFRPLISDLLLSATKTMSEQHLPS